MHGRLQGFWCPSRSVTTVLQTSLRRLTRAWKVMIIHVCLHPCQHGFMTVLDNITRHILCNSTFCIAGLVHWLPRSRSENGRHCISLTNLFGPLSGFIIQCWYISRNLAFCCSSYIVEQQVSGSWERGIPPLVSGARRIASSEPYRCASVCL